MFGKESRISMNKKNYTIVIIIYMSKGLIILIQIEQITLLIL